MKSFKRHKDYGFGDKDLRLKKEEKNKEFLEIPHEYY
jgi:hypothetical protein